MEWTKQAEEIVKNWSDAQRQLWEQWMKGMEGSMGGEMWSQMLSSWESNVKETLGAQGEWIDNWFESAAVDNMPAEMKQWLEQGHSMSKQWQETQQQVWHGWFELAREMQPAGMGNAAGGMMAEGEKIVAGWQSAAQEMVNAQMDMLKMWLPTPPDAGDKGKK